jgi:hypothetical protein
MFAHSDPGCDHTDEVERPGIGGNDIQDVAANDLGRRQISLVEAFLSDRTILLHAGNLHCAAALLLILETRLDGRGKLDPQRIALQHSLS